MEQVCKNARCAQPHWATCLLFPVWVGAVVRAACLSVPSCIITTLLIVRLRRCSCRYAPPDPSIGYAGGASLGNSFRIHGDGKNWAALSDAVNTMAALTKYDRVLSYSPEDCVPLLRPCDACSAVEFVDAGGTCLVDGQTQIY